MINMVDEFILYDDMQFTRRDWRNRNIIKTPTGPKWLTIPVEVKGKYLQKVMETTISNTQWRRQHWTTIVHNYSKAKYFSKYKDLFESLYLDSEERFLSRINYRFLTAICDVLGIRTKISWSMDYNSTAGQTERLVNLCKQTGAKVYISGPAAKHYLDEEKFSRDDITLRYMDYDGYPEYNQLSPPFEHRVSIIDLILNTGPDATKYMKSF